MDKNTILAILVIFLIWSFWPGLNKKPANLAPSAPPIEQPLVESVEPETKLERAQKGIKPKKSFVETPRALENNLVRIDFSSRYAAMKRITLKGFRTHREKNSSLVNLASESAEPPSFSLSMNSQQVHPEILDSFQEISFDEQNQEVTYRYHEEGMLQVERTYRLLPNSYNLLAKTTLKNLSGRPLREQPGLIWQFERPKGASSGGFFSFLTQPPDIMQSLALLSGDQLIKHNVKPGETKESSGNISWSSLGNRYFLLAVLPKWEGGAKLTTRSYEHKNGALFLENTLLSPQLKIDTAERVELNTQLFLGPKELHLLEAEGSHLNRALDMGYFQFFALFLLRLMQFFHRFLGNWGLAIIFLTILVKIAFFPLSQKSFKSMKEMQRIQPLLTDLRERYKDDKEQLNLQTLKIMREHKVNPLGGCLPMLIQLPIYFALYQVFYNSIELRHAPFYFWIKDLSASDPYFISPLLLGVSMFFQQKLSPKPADPMQAQMMNIMPIMFTMMMLFLPSGLVIYIFCNTMLSVLQQWYINRSLHIQPALAQTA